MSKLEKDLFGAVALVSELIGGDEGGEIAEVVRDVAKKHVGHVPDVASKGGFPGPPVRKEEKEHQDDDGTVSLNYCTACDAWFHPSSSHECSGTPTPRAAPEKRAVPSPKETRANPRPHKDAVTFYCHHCGHKNEVPR